MQISTWALTRSSSRWKTGRRSRSSALMWRKSRLDVLEVLVGGHHAGGVQLADGDGGTQHVEPVQGGFGVDLVLLAGDRQAVIGDRDGEVLAGLVRADHLSDLDADLAGGAELAGLDAGDDGGQQLLGGGHRGLALAGPLGGQPRLG